MKFLKFFIIILISLTTPIKADLNKNLFIESNPIPVKWMLYKMGLIDNILRLPLIELDTKYHEIISAEMIKLQLI